MRLGWIIFWAVFALLGIVLLIPLRITFSVRTGYWLVQVYYGWVRIVEKGSDVKPPQKKKPEAENTGAEMPSSEEIDGQQSEPQASDRKTDAAVRTSPPQTDAAEESAAAEEPADDAVYFQDEAPAESPKPKKQSFFEKLKPTSLADGKVLIGDVLASISPPLRLLTKHMHFTNIRLWVNVAASDAAKTAVMYGAVSAAAFWLLGQMQARFDVRADQYSVNADFLGEKTSFSVSGEYHSTPLSLLAVVLGAGTRFLWRSWRRIRRRERTEKAMAENEGAAKQSAPIG